MLSKSFTTVAAHSQGLIARRSITSRPSGSLEQLQRVLRETGQSANPMPRIREIRFSPLFNEVKAMIREARNAISDLQNAHLDPNARTAAAGDTLCHAIAGINDMATKYDLKITSHSRQRRRPDVTDEPNARAFMTQIKPCHVQDLKESFSETWLANHVEGQAAILSVLSPEVAADLGLRARPEHVELARQWGAIPPEQQLSEAELLALVDYVHSHTGTFNAVNGAAIAGAYYGEKVLPSITKVFSAMVTSAVLKLIDHPYFGKTNVKAYKGINLSGDSGPFRIAVLEAAIRDGNPIFFPQIISATSDPSQSYAATKYHLGYRHECEIWLLKAANVDCFHTVHTIGQMEHIGLPGAIFIVIACDAIEVIDTERPGNGAVYTRFGCAPLSSKHSAVCP